jgi:hypothetical protein
MTWKGIVGKPMTVDVFDQYVNGLFRQLGKPKFAWVQFCEVHNTAIPRFAPWVDENGNRQPGWHDVSGERRMKALEAYYRDDQKWSAGPHLFVADDFIWPFTPLWLMGVHSPSWNDRAWGIETVGDYNKEPLTAGVFGKLVGALAVLHRAAGFSPTSIRFHREDPKTTHKGCPGAALDKTILIRSVQQALGGTDFSDVESGGSSTAPASSRPILRIGAKGPDVADLQSLLGITNLAAPGTFGPLTHSRVVAYQQQHGLTPDGIVGSATWRSLLGG